MAAYRGNKKSVLFVCLGNICRSPIAEAVFAHLVNERGLGDKFVIESAATGDYHTGSSPDSRAIACMKKHDVFMKQSARQLVLDDFLQFDYIFGMDEDNIRTIKRMGPKIYKAKIELLGQYDPEGVLTIRDPYYDSRGDDKGFEDVYEQCVRCCKAFLDNEQDSGPSGDK